MLFAGGERLIREDFGFIAKYASKYFSVSVNTNGYLLKEFAKQLRDARVTIQLRLDGPEAQTHDFLRGEGSFERYQAIRHESDDSECNSQVELHKASGNDRLGCSPRSGGF